MPKLSRRALLAASAGLLAAPDRVLHHVIHHADDLIGRNAFAAQGIGDGLARQADNIRFDLDAMLQRATALASAMLMVSFILLLAINHLQARLQGSR